MGMPKQLLDWYGRPLLAHVIDKVLLHPFSEVIAVIGHEAERIKDLIRIEDNRFRWVINKQYTSGQASSIKEGLRHVRSKHPNVMVFLGDLPFITDKTVRGVFHQGLDLLTNCDETFAIQPVYQNKKGHPVFFGHVDYDLFAVLDGDWGGKILMNKIAEVKALQVDDPGIVKDLDTMDVYQKALKERCKRQDYIS
jgi:molybdenum cofactor cytidylyltransferase